MPVPSVVFFPVAAASAVAAAAGGRQTDKQGRRLEVYNEELTRLRADAAGTAEISLSFKDVLWGHFHRLPACRGPSLSPRSVRRQLHPLQRLPTIRRSVYSGMCTNGEAALDGSKSSTPEKASAALDGSRNISALL